MTKHDIIFLSLAQNCEKDIGKFFSTIADLEKDFKIYSIVGENGSKDFTFDKIIREASKRDYVEIIDTTFIEKFDNRIKRLSIARQKLKDIITDRKMIADFVCVVDLDDVLNSNFNKKNIVNLMQNLRNNEKRYFGISASSSPFYYDILNFSNDDLKSVKIIDVQDRKGLNSYFERKKYVYNNQKKFTKDSSFESISSFNGMCLYFYNDFIKSDYVSSNSKEIIPEHLNLNTKIYELTKKKLLVSNELVLNTPVEHMPPNSLIEFLSIRFLKYIKILLGKFYD